MVSGPEIILILETGSGVELETKVAEDDAKFLKSLRRPLLRVFLWLKVFTSAFTFKTPC